MNYPVELLEQIDLFLTGQLPDVERRAIERKMEADAAFRETVHAMQHTQLYLEEATLLNQARLVMKRLDQEHSVLNPVPVHRIGRRQQSWAIAAAMAAMMTVASGLYLSYSSISLANADISPQVHRAALATPTATLRPEEQQALNDFISANGFFVNGEYTTAITYYERAAKAPISDYLRECTWWNLSLAYLKQGNIQQAKRYFNQYKAVAKPHFQTDYLDQLRLDAQLLWAEIVA